jgi:hypothetical protein
MLEGVEESGVDEAKMHHLDQDAYKVGGSTAKPS